VPLSLSHYLEAQSSPVMPTVIYLRVQRLHFYSNEKGEPIHIHAEKGEKDCKYWLDVENYDQ
jgi:hypothetical protein